MAEDIFSHCFVCLFFGSLWKCFEFGAEIICSEKAWWSVIGSLKGIGKRISCFILAARFSIKFLSQSLAAIPWRLPLGPHRYARLLAVALLKYVSLIDECVDTVCFQLFSFFSFETNIPWCLSSIMFGGFCGFNPEFPVTFSVLLIGFLFEVAQRCPFRSLIPHGMCGCARAIPVPQISDGLRMILIDFGWFWIWFWIRMV